VYLGNRTDRYPNGDCVQTVERWHPPKTWAPSAELANKILDAIAKGPGPSEGRRYSMYTQATVRYVGPLMAQFLPEQTPVQHHDLITDWVKNRVLINDKYDDPVERRECSGLRVGTRPGSGLDR
jgi:hypothetical protein